MDDRELLEAAAKAIGWRVTAYSERRSTGVVDGGMAVVVADGRTFGWSPLHDDGDAFRLSIKLGLRITHYPIYEHTKHAVIVHQPTWDSDAQRHCGLDALERYCDDPRAATRRAIVLAAAQLGDAMGSGKP